MTTITGQNNRAAPRSRVLKGAKIIGLHRWTVMDCTVRDLSETGAKLLCGEPHTVANEFRFLLPTDNSIRNARVVWRRDGMLGIEFTGEKTKAPVRKI